MDENRINSLINIKLQNEEMGSEVYTLIVDKKSENAIPLGTYVLQWRRHDSDVLNTIKFPLKGLSVDEVPLFIDTVLPAYGFVRTPMSVTFQLYNRTQHLIQLDLTMDISEAFMFAGYKQVFNIKYIQYIFMIYFIFF